MGPNKWGIFLILTVTTGEGVGPAGGISPVVCMLKNGLVFTPRGVQWKHLITFLEDCSLNMKIDGSEDN